MTKIDIKTQDGKTLTILAKDGVNGAIGPKGDRGDKGDKGDNGKDGKDGKTGASGLDGKNGTNGKDGLDAEKIDINKVIDEVLSKIPKTKTGKVFNQQEVIDAVMLKVDIPITEQQRVVEYIQRQVSSKTYSLRELDDVTIGAQTNGQSLIWDSATSRWIPGSGGTPSPLTTKGDLYGFDTAGNRIPVGTNTQVLTADSTQPLGVKWATPATGDFVGPASSVDGEIVLFSGTTGKLGKKGPTAMTIGDTTTDQPTFGAEILGASGWTSLGWTGDNTTGWIHTVGLANDLTNSFAFTIGVRYQISWTVTNYVAGSFGVLTDSFHNTAAIASGAVGHTAIGVDPLIIRPTPDFDGKIVLSIKEITARSTPIYIGKDSGGTSRIEIRASSSTGNFSMGVNSGGFLTTGTRNKLFEGGANLTSGNRNSLFGGGDAITTGSDNAIFGYGALTSAVTLSDGTAFGAYAGNLITFSLKSLFLGSNACSSATGTVNGSTIVGPNSMRLGAGRSFTTTIGTDSFYSGGAGFSFAGGYLAGYTTTGGGDVTYVGHKAGRYAVSIYDVVAVGSSAGEDNLSDENTFIGSYCGANKTTGTKNAIGGSYAAYSFSGAFSNCAIWGADGAYSNSGNSNTGIGAQIIYHNTTGTLLSALGYRAGYGAGMTTNSNGVYLGANTSSSVNGISNFVAVGYSTQVTKSNQVMLGNASIAETILRGNVGIHQTSPQATLHIPYRTWSITGDLANLNPIVLNVLDTTGLFVGQLASHADIPAGATIASIDSATQITLSAAATATTPGATITVWVPQIVIGEGTILPTVRAGAIEAASDRLYYTIPTGPARKTLAYTTDIPTISDVAYDATSWNANTDGASKNAIRDKIDTMDTAIALNTAKVTNATHTGDATGATALTLATVNANVGAFTNANITVNAKGLVTAAANGTAYAPIASPTFTGVPAAPTAAAGTNTTQLATTAFVTAINNNSSYRKIYEAWGQFTASRVVAAHMFTTSGAALVASGVNTGSALSVFYVRGADFPTIGGKATKLRVSASVHVNDVAPGATFTFGLHAISRPATSGAASGCTYTIGTVVAGSNGAVVTTPAADSSTNDVGADFAIPADGWYALVCTTSVATTAVSSHTHLYAELQMRNA